MRKIMKLDLSAENPENGGYYYAELALPAENYEIRDALERLRAVGRKDSIWISVLECAGLPALENVRLDSPTLDELNFFAKRLASMTEEENMVFSAVVGQALPEDAEGELVSMKDLINSAYGLDRVMMASNIYNDEQLGQFVIEGDLDDDVNALPENAIPLLDRRKIGERFRTTYGCKYINETAVFIGDYKRPEIYDGKTLPKWQESEPFAFRLKVGEFPTGGATETEDDAEWISLPTNLDIAEKMAARHHEPSIASCVCYAFESTIPQITSDMFCDMLDFDKLNKLAWKFELLSSMDQVKCKAAFTAEQPETIDEALDIAESLWQYEFYNAPENSEQFFRAYLKHHLDSRFDSTWLDTLFARDEGDELLKRLGASVTDYGAISARSRSLYELVPYKEPEIRAEYAPVMADEETAEADTEENEEMQIGGMQL